MHSLTGLAPSVALHIPWDDVDDFGKLVEHAESLGLRLGTVNSNTFQDEIYKLGSLAHAEHWVRRAAIDHHFRCIEIMHQTGSQDLKIWLADGTNYPGQDDIRSRQDRLAESLAVIYERLSGDQRLVLEYKFFEPAFYHTDVPDWGTSYAHCAAWAIERWCASTPVTTRRARTSSSSSPSCFDSASSGRSTSTPASTQTTT